MTNREEHPGAETVPKQTLRAKAFQTLREMIISYQLRPGMPLRLGELSEMLNMSQTPIREALTRLEAEGLIQRDGQRGYVVRLLNSDEVDDLFAFRLILEVAAAKMAARAISEESSKELAEIVEKSFDMMGIEDRMTLRDLECDFHVRILYASGNKLLAKTGSKLLERIWIIQNFHALTSVHRNDVHGEHKAIFEAIHAKDETRAGKLMEEHLSKARDFILARLRNENDLLSVLVVQPLRMGA